MGKTILEVQNLTKYFDTPAGQLHAVDGVSFKLEEGKTLGVVGESGCGKSTTGRAILKLHEPTSGKIIFDGQDITKFSRAQMRKLRTEMQIVFQDPFSGPFPFQRRDVHSVEAADPGREPFFLGSQPGLCHGHRTADRYSSSGQ